MYKTIFFDLDDTLCDTVSNSRECLYDIYNEYEISKFYPTFTDFLTIYTPNTERLWAMYSRGEISKDYLLKERFLVPFRPFKEVTEDMAMQMNKDFLGRVKFKKKTIEGTKEILEYLKPKYIMHIISNGFSEIQYTKMESAGITSYFDKVILSDVIGVNKPHPDIFDYALKETGTDKKDAIMIGDNLFSDINGAKNSGIDQIWFNPNEDHDEGLQPTYTIKSLFELKDIL